MAPMIVLDAAGTPVAALGSPGGTSILAYNTKAIVGLLAWKLPLQQAIDLPNLIARGDTYFGEVLRLSRPPAVTAISVPDEQDRHGPRNNPFPMKRLASFIASMNDPSVSMGQITKDEDCGICLARALATFEVTMDIEIAAATAPGAAIDVYFANNTMSGWRAAVYAAAGLRDESDPAPISPDGTPVQPATVLAFSWGWTEAQSTGNGKRQIDIALQKARQLGITPEAAEAVKTAGALERKVQFDAEASLRSSCEELAEEVRRTVSLYGVIPSEDDDGLRSIFISGGGAKLADLRTLLGDRMGVSVRLSEPFRGFGVNRNLNPDYLAEAAPYFAVGAGLSVRRPGDK